MTSIRDLVPRAGAQVTANGRLLRDASGDWLEPFAPILLPANPGRPPEHSDWATALENADLSQVGERFEVHGTVEGNAVIFGVWFGDRMVGRDVA